MKPIQDEFSHIKSRQRRYQLRKHRDGLCDTCGTKKERYSHKCNRCMDVFLKTQGLRRKPPQQPPKKITTISEGAKLLARLNMTEYIQTNDMTKGWSR